MNYKVRFIPRFERELKRLAKKYPSLKTDFGALLTSLKTDPVQGIPLGDNCYKIRLAIASKRKGRSGGARVITCVKIVHETIFLVAIFDKSETENISGKELAELLKYID